MASPPSTDLPLPPAATAGPATILVVDDDAAIRAVCREALAPLGHEVLEAGNGRLAVDLLAQHPADLVLTDLEMPEMDGLKLARWVRAEQPATDLIVVTAHGSIASAVAALKLGIHDYLTKPFDLEALTATVVDLLEARRRRAAIAASAAAAGAAGRHTDFLLPAGTRRQMVGRSPRMREVFALIDRIKDARCNVLIQGESGTGKELVARAIHVNGRFRGGPFLAINSAGIPASLLESQLFGHVKGAFTGATADAPGLFRAAAGGTLFLDEVTEIEPGLQAKLLRAIQEREVLPVGSSAPVKIAVRLIAATNRPIEEALRDGTFREDLFYRLCVVPIQLPPLRERREDIPALLSYFIGRYAAEYAQPERELAPAALAALTAYAWPGNIREMENVVERVFATTVGAAIELGDLPDAVAAAGAGAGAGGWGGAAGPEGGAAAGAGVPTLEQAERRLIEQALAAAQGNKTRAAEILQIDRQRLYRKLEKYGL